VPYLESFAELEWHLGRVAIAVERVPVGMHAFAGVDRELLADVILQLQPGVAYFRASWPVDRLIELFLSESQPHCFAFEPAPVNLELKGARGGFQIKRLDRGTFAFRAAIDDGKSIGVAAESALAADPGFDVGPALVMLVAENTVTAVVPPSAGVPT
jgi:hypothetical protein